MRLLAFYKLCLGISNCGIHNLPDHLHKGFFQSKNQEPEEKQVGDIVNYKLSSLIQTYKPLTKIKVTLL